MGHHAAAAAKVAAAPRTANSRESLCAGTAYALAGLVAYEPRNQQNPQGGKLLNLRSNQGLISGIDQRGVRGEKRDAASQVPMKKQRQRLVNAQNEQNPSRQRHSRKHQKMTERHGSNRGAMGA